MPANRPCSVVVQAFQPARYDVPSRPCGRSKAGAARTLGTCTLESLHHNDPPQRNGLSSDVRSPLRPVPSLGRRAPRPAPSAVLIGVPRISPERELAAIRALIKPQAASALRHQIDAGEQALPPGGADRVWRVAAAARAHFGLDLDLHLPPAGEYLVIGQCAGEALPAALAAGLLLSHRLPGLWVVVGRLYVRNGTFYRRERGVKLNLRPASNVHLSKPLRAAFRRALAELEAGE